MTRRYTLRAATSDDRIFVESIYFQTQRSIIEALFGWGGDEAERSKFAGFYDPSNTTVIAEQGEDIGWMTIVRHEQHIELEHLYLDETRHGQGIGSALLRDLIKEADAARLPLRVSTAKINRARRLYERLGFVDVDTDQFKVYMERRNNSDVLDKLLESASSSDAWWDRFFADRTRSVDFFVDWPDETLVSDFGRKAMAPGRVLELGCGNGRNAVYMASVGCAVDGVDFSKAAITWAKNRAQAAGQQVHYIHKSIFELEIVPASYDIVYDSGCFHHVAPHRREAYVKLVFTALKPGGTLSLVCFCLEGGSGLTDEQVYEQRTLGGGLGYSEQSLRHIFEPWFNIVEMRRMNEMLPSDKLFGKDFLWAIRMLKDSASTTSTK